MHSGRKRRRPDGIRREEIQDTEILKGKAGESTEEYEEKPSFDWFTRDECLGQHGHDIREMVSPRVENLIEAAHCRRPQGQGAYLDFMEINTRLWHVPNIPPKPSFLDFLSRCTSMKVAQQKLSGAKTDKSRNNGSGTSVAIENDSSGMDEGDMTKQPCPEDIQKSKESASEVSGDAKYHKKMDKSKTDGMLMDETAAVAIGILAEECLISALLPLAKEHATRCRQLDQNSPSYEKNRSSSFVEWMLPSDQAMANLSDFEQDNSDGYSKVINLSSSQRPSVESIELALKHSQGMRDEKKIYFEQWCGRNGLEPDFVRNNVDFFRSFVGNVNAPSPEERKASLEEAKRAIRDTVETGSQLNNSESFPIPRIITKHSISEATVKQEIRSQDDGINML